MPDSAGEVAVFYLSGNQSLNGKVSHKVELMNLLRTSRRGKFGEFWLGDRESATLTIHTNDDDAYLWFCRHDGIAGFNSIGVEPTNYEDKVTFYQEGQGEFSMGRAAVVDVELAYTAAVEFLETLEMPACIVWSEL